MKLIGRKVKPGLMTGRIEAFSDGVFAIAITLLILTIAVPELTSIQVSQGLLSKSLIDLWPKVLSFVISFVIISIFWSGHIIMFHFIRKSDRTLIYLNSLLLLFISFFPFPAALIGRYTYDKSAIIIYGLTLMLLGITYVLIWSYASYKNRLMDKNIDPKIVKRGFYVLLLAPVLYLISVIVALINPLITLLIYVLIPFIYLIPSPVDDFVNYIFDENNESN